MSAFEFVLVAFAIIVGFGISEILGGWGQQIRARHRRTPYPLQIASSAFILFYSLQFLWGLWLLRDLTWTFPLYLLVSALPLALALAAHITRVDVSTDSPSAREQYFENSRLVYALMAVGPAVVLTVSAIPAVLEQVRDPIPNAPNLVAITLVRLALLSLLISLAWSQSEKYHWLGLGIVWTTLVAFVFRLAFRLAGSAV